MKKIVSFVLTFIFVFSLSACGSTTNTDAFTAEARYQMLVSALRKNGTRRPNGEYVIGLQLDSSSSAFISYSPTENDITFLCGLDYDNGSEGLSSITFEPTTGDTVNILFSLKNSHAPIVGVATLDLDTYSSERTTLYFSDGTQPLHTVANQVADTHFKFSMLSWSALLEAETDLTMKDIGFSAYEF